MNKALIIILAPIAILRLIIVIIFTFLCYLSIAVADMVTTKKPYRFLWWMMRFWAKSMLILFGMIMKVKSGGSFNKSGLILSNHRSYIDIFVNMAINPAFIISKKEVADWPMFGHGFKIYGMLLIDRKNYKSRVQNMRKIENLLLEKKSLILYPEGTTHRGPGIGPMKDSTFGIAANTQVPIYPIAIEYKNPDDAWVGNDLFVTHFLRRSGKIIRFVNVSVGEPITGNDKKELKAKTVKFIEQETLRMRNEFNKKY